MQPSYSNEALSVRSNFLDVDFMVYVEGDDDVIFWSAILESIPNQNGKVESLGGINELVKKKTEMPEVSNFLIACDRDYSDFAVEQEPCEGIIRTPGYSIENMMYCPKNLGRLVRKLVRAQHQIFEEEIAGLFEVFEREVAELLVYDIANYRFGLGQEVLKKASDRFWTRSKGSTLSPAKIDAFIQEIDEHFTTEQLDEVREMLYANTRPIRLIIRGHFLTFAASKFIRTIASKHRGRKVNISNEHIYTETVDGCKGCFRGECTLLDDLISSMESGVQGLR